MEGQRSKGGGGVSGFMMSLAHRQDLCALLGSMEHGALLPHGSCHGHQGMLSPGSGHAEAGMSVGTSSTAGTSGEALSSMKEASNPYRCPADASAGSDLASTVSG